MKRLLLVLPALALLLAACASTAAENTVGLSLLDAVEQSAEKIAKDLPKGSRVAIVAFESESDNLSDFIMEELTCGLVERGMEVADRQNLNYVYKELNFQMSGDVSDETAQAIGKFLAAQLVITGQLTDLGNAYRFRTGVIHVEKATRDSVTRFTVRNDKETRDMVAALAEHQNTVKTAKYGVSETAAPQTAGTFLDRGILFASRGDYKTAIADFSESLKLDPKLAAAYMLRGRAWFASASKVIGVDANFSEVDTYSTDRRTTAEQAYAFDEAISDFTAALRLDPNNAVIYRERGIVYSDKGDTSQAIADFDQAIRFDPNNAPAYNSRGIVYLKKKDYDRAIADFSQALRLDNNYTSAYTNRGVAYLDRNDYDHAIADFNQALRLNPNDASAYNNRGFVYIANGDLDRAIEDYTQALRLDPDYAEAYNIRANAYYSKKDYDRAIADYTHALLIDPNYAEAYNNRGVAYYNKKNYEQAIADFEMALRINQDNAGARRNLEASRQAQGR